MVAVGARQLALDLPHEESLARDDFVAAPSNADALAMIERWPDWPGPVLALVGPSGVGKSHLAAIWAQLSGARSVAARALNEVNLPAALATGALVLEDAASGHFEQRTLFHLLNLVREEHAYLLMTASSAPAAWPIGLLDLASRLRAIPTIALTESDDALLHAIAAKVLSDRQLPMDEALIAFLLTRVERSPAAVKAAIAHLDAEALRLKRPVTRALAAELFRSP